jgi:hypothetical protein
MGRNGIPNPFNPMDPDWEKPKPASSGRPVRRVTISPASKIRARSIGVSSSSRQRTHKRGPHNRSR